MNVRVDVAKLLGLLGIESRKRGPERWARCPFHDERTASWQIRDDSGADEHGLWRCFGCGVRGNAVGLVAALVGLSRDDAKAWLETSGCIEGQPPLPTSVRVVVQEAFGGFALPFGVAFGELSGWVTPARRYVQERGITPEQVVRWGIGYAVDGRLRGRIVFPIRDSGGRVVGYSARTFVGDAQRYAEPKSSDGYDPGAVFGEQFWPAAPGRGCLVVTEGAINALAVERAIAECPDFDTSIPCVGAIRGSHLDVGQIASMSTFRSIVVASDPDVAGDKLWRSLRALHGRSLSVTRAPMPVGFDCADVDARDRQGLAARIFEATIGA